MTDEQREAVQDAILFLMEERNQRFRAGNGPAVSARDHDINGLESLLNDQWTYNEPPEDGPGRVACAFRNLKSETVYGVVTRKALRGLHESGERLPYAWMPLPDGPDFNEGGE